MFKRTEARIQERMRRYVSRATMERRLEAYTEGYARWKRRDEAGSAGAGLVARLRPARVGAA